MAAGTKLQLRFDTMSGSRTWTFNYAKSGPTAVQVKALGAAMISNGSILSDQPVRLTEAKTVTTTENVYDLDS